MSTGNVYEKECTYGSEEWWLVSSIPADWLVSVGVPDKSIKAEDLVTNELIAQINDGLDVSKVEAALAESAVTQAPNLPGGRLLGSETRIDVMASQRGEKFVEQMEPCRSSRPNKEGRNMHRHNRLSFAAAIRPRVPGAFAQVGPNKHDLETEQGHA